MSAVGSDSSIEKLEAITPFDPEIGYAITMEDFDLTEAIEKSNKLMGEKIDPSKAPLMIDIGCDKITLNKLGLSSKSSLPKPEFLAEDEFFDLQPTVLDVFKRLRMQLSFPRSSYKF